MNAETIKFSKSLEQRIAEYRDILCIQDVLAASGVRKEWTYRAEIVLEPCEWQAVWKISRQKCKNLGIPFPTPVIVTVKNIDTEALTAQVHVMDSPDGLAISTEQEASLVNLYPTVNQNYKLVYIHETADYLDKFRFFYDFVWQPWDIDDDETQDWPTAHLETRLNLYYDIESGKISPDMVKKIQLLHQEARALQYNIEKLEGDIDDDGDVEADIFCNLMDMHERMDTIKTEFTVLENPHMRNLLLMKKQHTRRSLVQSLCAENLQNVCVVWPGGSIDTYIELLKASKAHMNEEAFMRTSSKLQNALDQTVAGGTVLVSAGTHDVLGLGEFEKGGTIKGISTLETTRLAPSGAGNVLLNCIGGEVTLENLTIEAQELQIALASCDTFLRLRNCQVVGQSGSSTSEGIIGSSGAKIELENCCISGFGNGLVVHSRAEASLKSCKITGCHIGIMIYDGGKLNLQKCTVSDCTEYGVKVEISKQTVIANKVGSISLLNRLNVGEVVVRDSSIRNNKGDVCIIQTHADAHYDGDSPTFSFLLSSDGLHTSFKYDEADHEMQKHDEEPEKSGGDPVFAVPSKSKEKSNTSKVPTENGVGTYSDISSHILSSPIQEEDESTNEANANQE